MWAIGQYKNIGFNVRTFMSYNKDIKLYVTVHVQLANEECYSPPAGQWKALCSTDHPVALGCVNFWGNY